jgi:hypothetical protein
MIGSARFPQFLLIHKGAKRDPFGIPVNRIVPTLGDMRREALYVKEKVERLPNIRLIRKYEG